MWCAYFYIHKSLFEHQLWFVCRFWVASSAAQHRCVSTLRTIPAETRRFDFEQQSWVYKWTKQWQHWLRRKLACLVLCFPMKTPTCVAHKNGANHVIVPSTTGPGDCQHLSFRCLVLIVLNVELHRAIQNMLLNLLTWRLKLFCSWSQMHWMVEKVRMESSKFGFTWFGKNIKSRRQQEEESAVAGR